MSRDPLSRGRALLDDAKRQARVFEGRSLSMQQSFGPVDPHLSAASGSLARDYRSLGVIYTEDGMRKYDAKLDCFVLREAIVFPEQQKVEPNEEGLVLSRKSVMLRF